MNFNDKAKSWDSDPQKHFRADSAAKVINQIIQDLQATTSVRLDKALEFGAGTALLSLRLADLFDSIIAADTSSGMLEIALENVSKQSADNISTALLQPDSYDYVSQFGETEFDAIYTMMALHHIEDLQVFCLNIAQLQKSGGLFFVIDITSEDGSFHNFNPEFAGHFGFDRTALAEVFSQHNYEELHYKIILEIEKNERKYPVFVQAFRKI